MRVRVLLVCLLARALWVDARSDRSYSRPPPAAQWPASWAASLRRHGGQTSVFGLPPTKDRNQLLEFLAIPLAVESSSMWGLFVRLLFFVLLSVSLSFVDLPLPLHFLLGCRRRSRSSSCARTSSRACASASGCRSFRWHCPLRHQTRIRSTRRTFQHLCPPSGVPLVHGPAAPASLPLRVSSQVTLPAFAGLPLGLPSSSSDVASLGDDSAEDV